MAAAETPAGPPRAVFLLESLEILCMGMLWTSLPILLESDSQPQRYGVVTGVASAIALATGAVFGRLSDVHGRQLVLLVAVSMFAASNILLFAAQLPLWEAVGVAPATLLILGALLGRCSSTSGSLRKAYVADTSPAAERTAALGKLAACGGCGFIVGPTLAGRLADVDVAYAVQAQLLLAAGSVAIAASVWHSSAPAAVATKTKAATPTEPFSYTELLFANRAVGGLMLASFFLSFGFQAFTSSFYLFVVRRFDFGPKEYGQLLSCLGAIPPACFFL